MSTESELAQIRFDNAMALFGEFVRAAVKHPDAATLSASTAALRSGCAIQPSYWSQIKARSRQIGERLARQFEQLLPQAGTAGSTPRSAAKAAPLLAMRPSTTTSASSSASC